jgi:hypothetical protein
MADQANLGQFGSTNEFFSLSCHFHIFVDNFSTRLLWNGAFRPELTVCIREKLIGSYGSLPADVLYS